MVIGALISVREPRCQQNIVRTDTAWYPESKRRAEYYGTFLYILQQRKCDIKTINRFARRCTKLALAKTETMRERKPRKGNSMKLLDDYLKLQDELFSYFGYKEYCKAIPIDDAREYYWYLTGEGHGDEVKYAKEKENVFDGTDSDGYSNEDWQNTRSWAGGMVAQT